jgi:hypothetical protein
MIPDSAATITEASPELEPTVRATERHLIILFPQSETDWAASKLQSFAKVTGLTVYDARLALQTQKHRILRKLNEEEKALELSKRLTELGIRHITLAEADVRAMPVEPVRRMALGDQSLELTLSKGNKLKIDYSDLLLLVRGEIRRESHKKPKKAADGSSRSLTPGLRLHIYGAGATVAAELDSEGFDWNVLPAEVRSPSTPLNFKQLTDELLLRGTRAKLDRGFDMEPVVLSRSEPVSGIGEILQGSRKSKGALYDNSDQFRFYARWRFLVELALSQPPTRDIPPPPSKSYMAW